MRKIEIINTYEFINEFPITDEIKEEIENSLNQYALVNNINSYRCYINYEHGWKGKYYDQWQTIIDYACNLLEQRIKSEDPISAKLVVL